MLPDVFGRMLDGVSPTIETTPKGTNRQPRQVWKAPSLLGMFAVMFVTDLTKGRQLRKCGGCGTAFMSGAHAAEYCSPKCRSLIIMRRHRAKQAKARKLHGQGKSATVIAKRLGSDVKIVRRWIKKAPGKKPPRRTRSEK